MSTQPILSVVIPTYNRAEMLEKCLEGFSRQTLSSDAFEILVVDDGSTDRTPNLIEKGSRPFAIRCFKQDHGGAARARNLGIKEAHGEIVLFTDDDCLVSPQLLEAHAAAHAASERLVARGPVIIVRSFDEIRHDGRGEGHYSMNFFCTSNASVKRQWLLRAGGFDEGFGRWEDAELGFRLRKLGLKGCFLPGAPVFHLKPVWKLEQLLQTALSDGRGAAKLFKAHPSIRTWFSSGAHPASLAAGTFLKPLVQKKIKTMQGTDFVNGLWERLIFHVYFVEGLKTK